jgi:Tol biopolymer transport system component
MGENPGNAPLRRIAAMRGTRVPTIAVGATVLLAIWLLAGCSGGSGDSGVISQQEPTATEEPTTTEKPTATEKPTVAEADGSGCTSEARTTARTTTTADSPDPMRLTNLGGTAFFPLFSPNGGKIAFLYTRERREVLYGRLAAPSALPALYTMNSDGTDLTCIADRVGAAAFSPDGTKIAFASYEGDDTEATAANPAAIRLSMNGEIYVASTSGDNRKSLTNSPASENHPTWSPDGKKIAFERIEDDGKNSEIYVMNSDGTNQTNLTNTPPTAHESAPSFSPTDEKIAFQGPGEITVGIYVMNADGANLARVSSPDAPAIAPRFSPDGTKILFMSGLGVFGLVNSDGSNLTQIVNEGADGVPGLPTFFPNGTKIAFPSGADGNEEIYAINIDGTNRVNLTNNPSAHDNQPSFSPDGKNMAYVSTKPSADPKKYVSEIYLMNLD